VRIDDRLLHGQVSLGWAPALGSKLIVVADDEVASDPLAAELYAQAAPAGVRVQVLTVRDAARRFDEFRDESLAAIVIVRTPADALRLVEEGAAVEAVNVGGLGHERGKTRILPFFYAGEEDIAALRRLIDLGIAVVAQDVPGGSKADVRSLLK